MAEESEEVQRRYPYSVARVYLNAATVGLAVFLMLTWVNQPLPLLFFMASTFLLAMFRFLVKVRYFSRMIRLPEFQRGDDGKSLLERSRPVWLLGLLAIVVSLPLLIFLTQVLSISIWLTALSSLAFGLGLSEIVFYVYCKRKLVKERIKHVDA